METVHEEHGSLVLDNSNESLHSNRLINNGTCVELETGVAAAG